MDMLWLPMGLDMKLSQRKNLSRPKLKLKWRLISVGVCFLSKLCDFLTVLFYFLDPLQNNQNSIHCAARFDQQFEIYYKILVSHWQASQNPEDSSRENQR